MQITSVSNGTGRSGPIALSLLDFCDVAADGSAEGGLAQTIESAVLADRLGFKRYWLTEHWGAGVSTPSPELLTPVIGCDMSMYTISDVYRPCDSMRGSSGVTTPERNALINTSRSVHCPPLREASTRNNPDP